MDTCDALFRNGAEIDFESDIWQTGIPQGLQRLKQRYEGKSRDDILDESQAVLWTDSDGQWFNAKSEPPEWEPVPVPETEVEII